MYIEHMTTQDLEQIGKVIDARLDAKIEPLRNDIAVLKHEIKATEERVTQKISALEKNLTEKISASQEDTIGALTDVINEAYVMHDRRIKRIEDHLDFPAIH